MGLPQGRRSKLRARCRTKRAIRRECAVHCVTGMTHDARYVQNKILYVYDPLALHSIIVKEQDIYEEPSFLIKLRYLLSLCMNALTVCDQV